MTKRGQKVWQEALLLKALYVPQNFTLVMINFSQFFFSIFNQAPIVRLSRMEHQKCNSIYRIMKQFSKPVQRCVVVF